MQTVSPEEVEGMERDMSFRHGNPNPGLALCCTKAWSNEGVLGQFLETGMRVVFASSRKDLLSLEMVSRVQWVVFVRSRTGHGACTPVPAPGPSQEQTSEA